MAIEAINLGCRLNGAETETMRRLAEEAGWRDASIVNTCAVTAEAGRRSVSAVRSAARDRPGVPIFVSGCAAEIEPNRFTSLPGVARLLPNAAKTRRDAWRGPDGRSFDDGTSAPASDATAKRVRAFIEVQNGCDHHCTFCTIPKGRGRSRSLSRSTILGAVRAAIEAGAREVVLTGVDLTSYAEPNDGGALGSLVRAILSALPDLPRLRLSSIDAAELDPTLLAAFAEEPRLMPHVHLSLQAGDDLILKRMRRRHSRTDAVELCRKLREFRPDIVFGADLIAGFPTETEGMFARTLDLVAECELAFLHAFPFSARPGTPASLMPAVPGSVVRDRAARLRAAGDAALLRHLEGETGRTRRVLVEGSGLARTEGFTPVRLLSPLPKGTIRDVGISGHDARVLVATV